MKQNIAKSKKINLPGFAQDLFKPYRHKVLYGGRGSAKSYSIARALIMLASSKKLKILCGREFQNSINDSVHSLLKEQIYELDVNEKFEVGSSFIRSICGSEFLFKGVRHNINSIKSIPDIDILWLEEADTVSKESWDVLIPTIRKEGSEIWVSYNPQKEDDPTHVRYVNTKTPPENSFIKKVSWRDNPWFPEVLEKEKDHLFKVNPDLAMHVWEGECRNHGDAQIFKDKWMIDRFEVKEHWDGPYVGVDWGFSIDPTVIVETYIDMSARNLYIRRENSGVGVEFEDLPELFSVVPDIMNHNIKADCARPETISYMKRKGYRIEGAKKWKGSVEDGIDFLKSFNKIIIHEECPETITEAKNYSYKVDRLSQKVTTDIVDAYNHSWDAIRYALEPIITANGGSIFDCL